jgi:hypothetical protein
MGKRVLLVTGDLTFRTKLRAVVQGGGGAVVRDDGVCDVAVIEIGVPGWEGRVAGLVGRGIPVLAFGSHVRVDLLRVARAAGAQAVPNSQVEERLRAIVV